MTLSTTTDITMDKNVTAQMRKHAINRAREIILNLSKGGELTERLRDELKYISEIYPTVYDIEVARTNYVAVFGLGEDW